MRYASDTMRYDTLGKKMKGRGGKERHVMVQSSGVETGPMKLIVGIV